jgi:hypothetical protein
MLSYQIDVKLERMLDLRFNSSSNIQYFQPAMRPLAAQLL